MELYMAFVMQEVYSGFINVWINDHSNFLIETARHREKRDTKRAGQAEWGDKT